MVSSCLDVTVRPLQHVVLWMRRLHESICQSFNFVPHLASNASEKCSLVAMLGLNTFLKQGHLLASRTWLSLGIFIVKLGPILVLYITRYDRSRNLCHLCCALDLIALVGLLKPACICPIVQRDICGDPDGDLEVNPGHCHVCGRLPSPPNEGCTATAMERRH